MSDQEYMQLALEEAIKGCGWVNPNPMVGAVIVKDGNIIGKGYHQKYGELHAERNALAACSVDPKGATIYVTLEPCCHWGKTPPCTDAIIASGIAKVVFGTKDPHSLVAGKGIKILKQHGIEVTAGVLEDKCQQLNEVFFHYIRHKTPFVVIKYAMTIDGKTATVTGKSQWITGEAARRHVHGLRHRYSAIMVGVGTVIADDPMLNCRLPNSKNPVRIICDTNLRIPLNAKVVQTANEITTFIATSANDSEKITALKEKNINIISVPAKNGHINLQQLMTILGEKSIDSIILEGGATLHAAALESGIVSKVMAYIAPKIFGGEKAKSAVGGKGIDDPGQAYQLSNGKITQFDQDILLEYTLKRGE